jgi:hypothetical protein
MPRKIVRLSLIGYFSKYKKSVNIFLGLVIGTLVLGTITLYFIESTHDKTLGISENDINELMES